jgi:hypothetical protein
MYNLMPISSLHCFQSTQMEPTDEERRTGFLMPRRSITQKLVPLYPDCPPDWMIWVPFHSTEQDEEEIKQRFRKYIPPPADSSSSLAAEYVAPLVGCSPPEMREPYWDEEIPDEELVRIAREFEKKEEGSETV